MSEMLDFEDFGAGVAPLTLSDPDMEVGIEEPERYNEKCGVFGVFNVQKAAHTCYYGMVGLQHRGQEGGGMVAGNWNSNNDKEVRGDFMLHRGIGLVTDVFSTNDLNNLEGNCAIGHTRYSTAGGKSQLEGFQPFSVKYRLGNLALAHNGNLSNFTELRSFFEQHGVLMQSTVDSELFLHLISHSKRRSQLDQIFDAMSQVAVRDPNGFRPLCLGKLKGRGPNGSDGYCVASETCALDLCKAEYVRDVEPGEMVIINRQSVQEGKFTSLKLPSKFGVSQCIFEYVYFARPDSQIFGDYVTKVRRAHGRQLAREHPVPDVPEGDLPPVVIPVPDSAAHATLGFVEENIRLGKPCQQDLGFFRNPYVGRSFIAPSQEHRDLKVRCKFNPMTHVCAGRVVVLLDDSIVRGTTAKQLIGLVLQAGAKEVHFRVASPPVTGPCFYGMDFPTKEELFFNHHKANLDSMAKWLGVKSIGYLSADGLVNSTEEASGNRAGFCTACFTGKYPIPVSEASATEMVSEKVARFHSPSWIEACNPTKL